MRVWEHSLSQSKAATPAVQAKNNGVANANAKCVQVLEAGAYTRPLFSST